MSQSDFVGSVAVQRNNMVNTPKKSKKSSNSKTKQCAEDSCEIMPYYNFEGQKGGLYCFSHAKPGMIDVLTKRCAGPDCKTSPNFNFPGQPRKFCKFHAVEGMIDVKTKPCEAPDCKTTPSYNFRGEKRPKFCALHKKPGMIDMKMGACAGKDGQLCDKLPLYNIKGERKGVYCFSHKDEGMINVIAPRCKADGCDTVATYNFADKRTPAYCINHIKPGMVNVKSNLCAENGCDVRPAYNFKDQRVPKYCFNHAKPDMIDIVSPRCAYDGCEIVQPCFNFEGLVSGKYCFAHKLEGMVNIKTPLCVECETSAHFNYCGLAPAYCGTHKKSNMVYQPRKQCSVDKCKNIASHGSERAPERCEDHSLSTDYDFRVAQCTQCGRDKEYLDKDGLCFTYCKPDKAHTVFRAYQKIKEDIVLKYLDNTLVLPLHVTALCDDKMLDPTCNQYRPDRVYDCKTHYVIVEIDEHQHRYKGKGCHLGCHAVELIRMHEIQNSAGVCCIFLRFNPDVYTVADKEAHTNLDDRMLLLSKWISVCFSMVPADHVVPVRYKYLFYDEFDPADVSFDTIDDILLFELQQAN